MSMSAWGVEGLFDDNLLKKQKIYRVDQEVALIIFSRSREAFGCAENFRKVSMPLGMLFRSSSQWNLIHIVLRSLAVPRPIYIKWFSSFKSDLTILLPRRTIPKSFVDAHQSDAQTNSFVPVDKTTSSIMKQPDKKRFANRYKLIELEMRQLPLPSLQSLLWRRHKKDASERKKLRIINHHLHYSRSK